MDALNENAGKLLKQIGRDGSYRVSGIKGAGSNRVFRVETDDRTFILKTYNPDTTDRRERQKHEFEFLKCAWENGIRTVPEPLAELPEAHVALYSFVPGRKLRPQEVRSVAVNQSLSFILALNAIRDTPSAQSLSSAADACFRVSHHLHNLSSRIERVKSVQDEGEEHRRVQNFVSEELAPMSAALLISLRGRKGVSEDKELAPEARCLSPGDFGMHNTLLNPDEQLVFLDFENAGWDDPARMVCDFFFYPELPVPWKSFGEFSRAVTEAFPADPALLARISLLMPVYGLKWCCAALNDFLPSETRQRNFGQERDESDRLLMQIEKAEQLLQKTKAVQEELWGK